MNNDDELGLAPAELAALRPGTARAELDDRIRAAARRGPAPTVLAPRTNDDPPAQDGDCTPAPTAGAFAKLVSQLLRRRRV